MAQQNDRGLTVHRVLQWIVTITTGVTTALVLSGYDTWEKFKTHMVRMENVPQDVRDIKKDMDEVKTRTANHEWRISTLEKTRR